MVVVLLRAGIMSVVVWLPIFDELLSFDGSTFHDTWNPDLL
jgi:hypothetical protein